MAGTVREAIRELLEQTINGGPRVAPRLHTMTRTSRGARVRS
jgi:hypothetical protein